MRRADRRRQGLFSTCPLALAQVDAAVEAAHRAAQPAKKTFAIGFQTGHEMNWLPRPCMCCATS